MDKITKKISMLEIINQSSWYNQEKDNLTYLSIQARWNLKKNMIQIQKFANSFYDFKSSFEEELKAEYMTDEKSYQDEIEQNGQKQLFRKIKSEYLQEYEQKVTEINTKINQLLDTEEEISLYIIDMDSEIEKMDRNVQISDETMERLMFFMGDAN